MIIHHIGRYFLEEEIMAKKIRQAAVIGSGVMGGGIAALLAAGYRSL